MEHGHDKHSAVEASSIPEENSSLGIGVGQRNKTTGLVSLYDASASTEYNAGKRRTTSRRRIVKSNDVIGEL
ncbi:hypothetical protein T03_8764 [Trichinella britovi]|uniref:Uncharacterized protein n=2 Tax=Trichinella TaxID=6333 RepID=A0A0V1D810_TRIBR|nr:hypothetical protein T05_4175 [Trichinella murrelli]KRY57709.1 hypothetical protein T03_8764 [Trichinella britovi]